MRKVLAQILLIVPAIAVPNATAWAWTSPGPNVHGECRTSELDGVPRIGTSSARVALRTVLGRDPEETQNTTPNKKALIGSWVETVTFPPEFGRPPLKSLATFHEDHTFVHSDQGSVTLVPQEVYSSGHGIWRHVEGRVFEYTSRILISDLAGNLIGQLKFRGTFTVSESGNQYTGTTVAQILDAGGTPLFSVEVANTAERIVFDEP